MASNTKQQKPMVADQTEKTLAIVSSEGSFRKITVEELNNLGYELTGSQTPMGDKPFKYVIMEVKNEDNKQELSFCYLYSLSAETGVILPNRYGHYMWKKWL